MIEIIISILLLIIFYKKNFKKDIYFCNICFEKDNKLFIDTICNHKFHYSCLEKWKKIQIKNKNIVYCPLCRRDLLEINEEMLNKIEDALSLYFPMVLYNDIVVGKKYYPENKLNLRKNNLSLKLYALKCSSKYKNVKIEDFLSLISKKSKVDFYILEKFFFC